MLLHIGVLAKLAFHIACVHWGSELQSKLLAHSPTPVAQPRFLLLQWWFHLFSLIIPVDIKLSRQAGGYIVSGFTEGFASSSPLVQISVSSRIKLS